MFIESPRFPEDISFRSRGGAGFQTNIIKVRSREEERVSRWSTPEHTYDVRYGIKTHAQLVAVRNLHMAARGAAYGFRFKDWKDFTTTADGRDRQTWSDVDPTPEDQEFGTGDGTTTVFQLSKTYSHGTFETVRNITKPTEVSIAIDGVVQASGWSVDLTTGLVTFSTAPALGEKLTWGGRFDVPVRFGDAADESLKAQYEDPDLIDLGEIPLVEISSATDVYERYHHGGGKHHSNVTANVFVQFGDGVVHTIDVQAASLVAQLPTQLSNFEAGWPYFTVSNIGPTHAIELRVGLLGALVATIAAGSSVLVWLGVDTDGTTKKWYAL